MQYQRINITLPSDLANRLRRTIPARSRSKFISRALSERLDEKRNIKSALIKSLRTNYELDQKFAGEWKDVGIEKWPD